MTCLSLAVFVLILQEESEQRAENPWLAGLLIAFSLALLFGIVAWRLLSVKRGWQQRMRTVAVVVPFVDEQALFRKLSAILRPYGLRQNEITGHPIMFEPSSFRKLTGAIPISLEILGNRTAKIVGPAAVVRAAKLQFPGAEEGNHPSEIPSMMPLVKLSVTFFLLLVVVIGAVVMVTVLQSR